MMLLKLRIVKNVFMVHAFDKLVENPKVAQIESFLDGLTVIQRVIFKYETNFTIRALLAIVAKKRDL